MGVEVRDDMKSRFQAELSRIESYASENNMVYKLIGDALIVVTDIAYWKITYLPEWQSFALHHGNSIPSDVNPETYIDADYHFQRDMRNGTNIFGLMVYIMRHDKYRLSLLEKVEEMPRRTKKQKAEYKAMKQIEMNYNHAIILQMQSATKLVLSA